jgi:hypothetical protein
VGNLVFDSTMPVPHTTGPLSVWSGFYGLECWGAGDGGTYAITPIGITSATIGGTNNNVVTLTCTSQPIAVGCGWEMDNTNYSVYAGGQANGRICAIRDSDAFVGRSGGTQYNEAIPFYWGTP